MAITLFCHGNQSCQPTHQISSNHCYRQVKPSRLRLASEESPAGGGTRSFFQQRHANLPDGFTGTAVVQSVTNQPGAAVVSADCNP